MTFAKILQRHVIAAANAVGRDFHLARVHDQPITPRIIAERRYAMNAYRVATFYLHQHRA